MALGKGRELIMWVYEKKLQYPVNIKNPNPALAKFIISQLGGPDGEIAASLRYLNQRYVMPYAELKGTLTDIGTEELAHVEPRCPPPRGRRAPRRWALSPTWTRRTTLHPDHRHRLQGLRRFLRLRLYRLERGRGRLRQPCGQHCRCNVFQQRRVQRHQRSHRLLQQ